MAFWNKKKNTDVNTPVENPSLKKAIKRFNANKTEVGLQAIITELKKATFLVLLNTTDIDYSKVDDSDRVLIKPGSTLRFLKTQNEDQEVFQPIFTDWKEIDLWVESRDNIAGWMMSAKEIMEFVLKNNTDTGLVINPCSDLWSMDKIQIAEFLKEFK